MIVKNIQSMKTLMLINVDSYTKIPKDYDGYMGVPITFLDKYNPNQFKLLGLGISNSGLEIGVKPYKTEHKKYRKKKYNIKERLMEIYIC